MALPGGTRFGTYENVVLLNAANRLAPEESGQPGFFSKPVAASSSETCPGDYIGRCRPNWTIEMAIYSLTGTPALHFTLNQHSSHTLTACLSRPML
jgi:hypothetical protein